MRRSPVAALRGYLLGGVPSRRGCLAAHPVATRPALVGWRLPGAVLVRALHAAPEATATPSRPPAVPLRKQLKDEAKQAKKQGKKKSKGESQVVEGWELTVGIEIHAQLNTSRKLFSSAITSFNDEPNSHVALFDVAMPGSHPLLQEDILPPAIRAALALNCDVQRPSGYQITQYYEPLARNGHITLRARDGIAPEDGESVAVGIKQIQLEQDTAKTLAQTGNVHWLDFNRVGVPLIEIITEPHIHHPRTAAIFVRKVQLLLNTVDSCVSGMETGGLRADVNVSVRRTDGSTRELGTRTEIKNLSTIKAIEDAIIAERDRQIRELEAGGVIAGETRGWTLGSKETRRLRGKEGEVDYRYMPDPDIAPLVIGDDLVEHLRTSLAVLPDVEMDRLVDEFGLTSKDALSLITLDMGARIEYFYRVLDSLDAKIRAEFAPSTLPDLKSYSTLAGNWIIHELGRLTTYKAGPLALGELSFTPDGECPQVPASELSQLLYHLYRKHITGKVAKELLVSIYLGELEGGVLQAINVNDLWFKEISEQEYSALADAAMEGEEKVLQVFVEYEKFPQGKLMYLVGKMMRLGPTERIDPATAEGIVRQRVEAMREP
ncbi:gatB/GatE catalytic domain-containing protein [Hirsutella rhossiliensis]|uniref:Glutamyl-tRNA(Gln) amidotransferase subunit B, mitochondrial n=1 Tax=Hirsutella rhossiliensis TaxID=111463 RepID=A0A9P8N233_9HYPO|nr:gatB/GatE catalytic domain-containing protein [Hirsutella rhossiliensis]KAH0965439.1 gatB/GatE catalytic domain-containing protein [Hirsutella rhossiliensis]